MKKIRIISVTNYDKEEVLENKLNGVIEEEIILGNKFLTIKPERTETNVDDRSSSFYSRKRWYILIFKMKRYKNKNGKN